MATFDPDRPMYAWRALGEEQRRAVLAERRRQRRPWHSPPHYAADTSLYLVTAACFEHRPVIGRDPSRMAAFERELLDATTAVADRCFAWIVLPNHYHLLVDVRDVRELLSVLGRLHGRTSFRWNGEENRRGRQVWFNAAETAMKSERHFWASLNYVLHNAVHHRYARRWTEWPYSNAAEYLESTGREQAERRWRAYPVLDYGKNWDPPEL